MVSKKILTHPKVRKLQRTLYQQAKSKPNWKAWSLYGDLCRTEVIEEAMFRMLENKGSAGIDGYTLEQMEQEWSEFCNTLQQELKSKTYKPQALLRQVIPKQSGGSRDLSIPTVRDRVVQCAIKMLIEPIFEADFHKESYGYRPQKKPHDAINSIWHALYQGKTTVIEADLSRYFDTIEHKRLMKLLCRRVSDGSLLHLIKLLLRVSTVEKTRKKVKKVPRKNKNTQPRLPKTVMKYHSKQKVGVPQGGVFSPLMGNLYMDALDKAVNSLDPYRVKMVRFADDFVIAVNSGLEEQLLKRTNSWLEKAGLHLNLEKTQCTDIRKGGKVEFLGFELSQRISSKTGNRYIHRQPNKKAEMKYRDKVRTILNHYTTWKDSTTAIEEVNRVTRGWGNYFHYGMSYSSFSRQNYFVMQKVRRWLRAKHRGRLGKKGLYSEYPDSYLKGDLGLYTLPLSQNL